MDKLFELGVSEDNLVFMLEQSRDILNMSNEEISEKIEILSYAGCNDRNIKQIIVSNPNYLVRITDDVLKLINYLKKLNFKNINLLFEMNPYFLNYDVFEIEDYIDSKLCDGIHLNEIIDSIENNPYVIDED